MISNYIKSLIDAHSRVIVPDLGAFMLKGDASKTIYFNEFLRFNDGLLIDYIAEQEKIDKIEAAKKIKAFVDNANKLLLNNKSVELKGLGTLYLDVNEKIQLKTSESVSHNSKSTEPETEAAPREILFELEKTEPAAVQTKSAEPEQTSVPKSSEPPAKSKMESVSEASVQGKRSAAEPQAKPKDPQASDVKDRREKTSPSPRTDDVVIDVVPTTTRRMVIVGIIGILVIGAIAYFAFFRSTGKDSNTDQNITLGGDSATSKKDTSVKTKLVDATSNNKMIPSKKPDAKHKESPKKEPTTTKITSDDKTKIAPKVESAKATENTSSKRFYVVAGTFSVEGNADKMFKKLKEEGYQPEKIRNDTKNVFYVSYSSFTNKPSAAEEVKKLKSAGTDAWIYAN